jgi:hypothetical protein
MHRRARSEPLLITASFLEGEVAPLVSDTRRPLLNQEEHHSYKNDYNRFLALRVNGCISFIPLVGAGRFERPTPCAQGRFQQSLKMA